MQLDLQRSIVRTILDLADRGTTQLADDALHVAATDYTSDATFAREQQRLFRDRPIVACLSCDLPEPGDHIAATAGGVPYLVIRQADGTLRAHANMCRHRGAPLVDDGVGHIDGGLRCGFHGWTYAVDGRVTARPGASGGFDGVPGCDALVELAVAEGHGMVFVRPGGGAPIDVDDLLAGMGHELDAFGFGGFHRVDRWEAEWSANWKLLADTFLETYHVPALHPTTVARHFLARPSIMEAFGPNLRFHSLMRSVLALRDVPEADWSLLPHGTVEYLVAPNTIFNFSVDHLALYQFHPLGPGRTRSVLTLYTPRAVTDADAEHFRRTLALHQRVSGGEDFVMQEKIQRSLSSGALDAVVFGRNEPAAIAFHRALHALLEA